MDDASCFPGVVRAGRRTKSRCAGRGVALSFRAGGSPVLSAQVFLCPTGQLRPGGRDPLPVGSSLIIRGPHDTVKVRKSNLVVSPFLSGPLSDRIMSGSLGSL